MSLHEDLKAYIDGELDSVRAEEVRVALDRDPALRQEFAQLQALSTGLREASPAIAVRGLDQTLAALERAKASRRTAVQNWIYGLGFSVATVFLAAILFPVFAQSKSAAKRTAFAANFARQRSLLDRLPFAGEASSTEGAADASAAKAAPAHDAIKRDVPALSSGDPVGGISLKAKAASPQIPKAGRVDTSMKSPAVTNGFADGLKQITRSARRPTLPSDVPHKYQIDRARDFVPLGVDVDGAPTTVTILFSTTAEGVQKVLAVAGKYQKPQTPHVYDSAMEKQRVVVPTQIVLDIPDDIADKVIQDIRRTSEYIYPQMQAKLSLGKAGNRETAKLGAASDSRTVQGKAVAKNSSTGNVIANAAPENNAAVLSSSTNLPPTAGMRGAGRGQGRSKTNSVTLNPKTVTGGTSNTGTVTLNQSTNSNSVIHLARPKTRRVIVTIQEKPKQDPVP